MITAMLVYICVVLASTVLYISTRALKPRQEVLTVPEALHREITGVLHQKNSKLVYDAEKALNELRQERDKLEEMRDEQSNLLSRFGITAKQLRAVQDMYKKLEDEHKAVTREMNSARFELSNLQTAYDAVLTRLERAESGAPSLSELEKKIVKAAVNMRQNTDSSFTVKWSNALDALMVLCTQYEREKKS